MKQVIKTPAILVIAVIITQTALAQKGLQLIVNYNTATPLGSGFRDYISNTSFRGSQGSLYYGVNNQFRFGLQVSYNDFYQKHDRQVYKTNDGSDISTVLSNSLQSAPLLVKGEYSIPHTGFIKPFVGFGAGIDFINYDQYLGEFEYDKHYTNAAFT